MPKKIVYSVIGIIIISFFLYLISYLLILRSEPYKIARQFIMYNPSVNSNIGHVNNIRLNYFGYSLKYTGPYGNAKFSFYVVGEKGQKQVYITLKKETGNWEVEKAYLVMWKETSINLMNSGGNIGK